MRSISRPFPHLFTFQQLTLLTLVPLTVSRSCNFLFLVEIQLINLLSQGESVTKKKDRKDKKKDGGSDGEEVEQVSISLNSQASFTRNVSTIIVP